MAYARWTTGEAGDTHPLSSQALPPPEHELLLPPVLDINLKSFGLWIWTCTFCPLWGSWTCSPGLGMCHGLSPSVAFGLLAEMQIE